MNEVALNNADWGINERAKATRKMHRFEKSSVKDFELEVSVGLGG